MSTATTTPALGRAAHALAYGRPEEAGELAAAAVAEGGGADAWLVRGAALSAVGDRDAARTCLVRALDEAPDHVDARLILVLADVCAGDLEAREAEVAALLADDYRIEDGLTEFVRTAMHRIGLTPMTVPFRVGGLALSWTLPHGAEVDEHAKDLYHWLPWQHNAPASVDRFYAAYDRYQDVNDARAWRQMGYVASMLGLAPGRSVLDAGCGTGTLLAALVQRHGVVPFGVDGSARAAAIAREQVPGITVAVADLEDVPFPAGSFDHVVSADTLEHVRRPWRVVRGLHRLLRPGGTMLLLVPDGRFDTYIGHVNFFSTQSLEALLEDLPLQRIDVHRDGISALVGA